MNRFYKRIDYIEDISILAKEVCKRYNLGAFVNASLIEVGYEDFNVKLETEKGKCLLKVFNNNRSNLEVMECVNRTDIAGINGVCTPKVYRDSEERRYSTITIGESRFRVALLEFINGKNFFELNEKPTYDDLNQIIDIASQLSKIQYRPAFIYDPWAISSFAQEYESKIGYFNEDMKSILKPIYNKFIEFDYDSLPKSFVHGDMMSTNLMKDNNSKIWLIDFSVANYTARINEIIVICDDLALIEGDVDKSKERIEYVFDLWCRTVGATDFEKESFKLLFKVANAINVMNATYEQINGNTSEETKMHLNVGKFGLSLWQ